LQEVWVQFLVREVIPHALRPKEQNIKQKEYCNRFNKDFKNVPPPFFSPTYAIPEVT